MSTLPQPVEELLMAALVGELTVLNSAGRPVTYPLIPLYDGDKVYLTSSLLFSAMPRYFTMLATALSSTLGEYFLMSVA